MTQGYRADIDGLRAISVLAILFYHVGIAAFKGGFVGVDVFFVISGFLIVRGIHSDIELGKFTIAKFYERRARRILPALIVLLLFVSLWMVIFSFPEEMRNFAPSLIGAVLFGSNLVFWKQSSYFEPVSEEKPLLHTWSLGVEEQFYIIIPLVMLVITRFMHRHIGKTFITATLLSFALSMAATYTSPISAFYLLPSRAWELLLGAIAGLGFFPAVARKALREGISLLGIVLVVISTLFATDEHLFPAPVAAIPVVGTALILAYGKDTRMLSPLLTNPVSRFFGQISYSLYLWHWPIVVFARLYGYLEGGMLDVMIVLALTIFCGWASWRYVEQPFRNRQRVPRKSIYRISLTSMSATLLYATPLYISDGWPSRYTPREIAFETIPDFSPRRHDCHLMTGKEDPERRCILGGKRPHMAIWSDSHGVELGLALSETVGPIKSFTHSNCPPALGWRSHTRLHCFENNKEVLKYLIRQREITTVYLTAYYISYIRYSRFRLSFAKTVAELEQAGKQVIVVGPTPAERDLDLPRYIARTGATFIERSKYEQHQSEVLKFLKSDQFKNVSVWFPEDQMCDRRKCLLSINRRPVLFDSHHLSMAGARYLVERVYGKRAYGTGDGFAMTKFK